jgi:kynurenine formamidase
VQRAPAKGALAGAVTDQHFSSADGGAGDARRFSREEFQELFESVRNWGRWGTEDRLGALNFVRPEHIRRAASLVRLGRTISLSLPVNTAAGPDNRHPAVHYMATGHDDDIGSGSLRFATDYIGMEFHGDCHTHIDALCHVSYGGRLYNDVPVDRVSTKGASDLDISDYARGIVGRGVLIDIPRVRGISWVEPGEAVTRAEIEHAEAVLNVRLEEGDILVFRTGHHRRRLELGSWNSSHSGAGRAGLHVDAISLLHERNIAAFFPDGDGETVPSTVEGVSHPIHALQITAMGLAACDSLNLEELSETCNAEERFEFLVVGSPLRFPHATGSPFNPLAVL